MNKLKFGAIVLHELMQVFIGVLDSLLKSAGVDDKAKRQSISQELVLYTNESLGKVTDLYVYKEKLGSILDGYDTSQLHRIAAIACTIICVSKELAMTEAEIQEQENPVDTTEQITRH